MIGTIVMTGAGAMLALLLFWRFWFLRDPDRTIPEGDNIVSPADGQILKVVDIPRDKVTIDKGMLGQIETITKDVRNACYLVSIFMSPLDVHVQRAPINGRVRDVRYSKGKFRKADSLRVLDNEHNEILIDDIDCVKVVQIAGFVARRIHCYIKKGDQVLKGQRIGQITLGSQVAVIIPKNTLLRVKEGQRVRAGETVLADFD